MIEKPNLADAPAYYHQYFALVKEEDLMDGLQKNTENVVQFLAGIPEEKGLFRYAEGKWTVKEVISHIIDTERIFAYRCMRFSRKDATELPGYDENLYAPNSNANNRTIADLMFEFTMVRQASISLFSYLTDEMLDFKSIVNKTPVTARGMGWMMLGHTIHHCNIIQERYLIL